jgi:hypothetical protein
MIAIAGQASHGLVDVVPVVGVDFGRAYTNRLCPYQLAERDSLLRHCAAA